MRQGNEARAQFVGAGGCGHSTVGHAVEGPQNAATLRLDASGMLQKPVDLVHLAKQTHGNHDLEEEVLNLFLSQSSLYLDRLTNAPSTDERRMAAHTLRGSALAIGAWDVARQSKAIELAPEGANDPAQVEQLSRSIAGAQAYIRSLLN